MSLITIANVSKVYQSASNGLIAALEEISLQIDAGEFVCLVGPTGCGKSTILRLLAGFEYPTRGKIYLEQKLVTKPGPDRIMVFQEAGLWPWLNVRHNIEFGLTMNGKSRMARRQIVDNLLKITNLERFANSRVHELSGGMKQKVALARALAPNPKILLMDEPFVSLDAQTRRMMQEELLNIWSRTTQCKIGDHEVSLSPKTILFVTHNVNEAITLADRIVVLTKCPGRIKKVIPVVLARPRARTNYDFNEVRQEVYNELESEVTHVYANQSI